MLYFHITIIISAFRSAFFRKSCIYLPPKSIKWNQIKNHYSCKVPISCTTYIFLSHRLTLNSATTKWKTMTGYVISNCFWTRNKTEYGGFLKCMSPSVWFLYRLLLKTSLLIHTETMWYKYILQVQEISDILVVQGL